MGFRSGDWLGHFRTLICFFLSYSFVALAVCFGSLSCWKTHPRPIFSALTEGRRLSPKISRYMAPFILPSIRWSRPVPFAEKHPQSIRFPPPCFTVGMVFLGLYSAFLFLESSWCQIALFWSHQTTSPSPKPPPDHPGVLWQTTDRPVPSSPEEPCTHSRILILHGVLLSLHDCGPNCLQIINKLLLCSTGLIPDLSHHHWYSTRSCVEPQTKEDWRWLCVSSIF